MQIDRRRLAFPVLALGSLLALGLLSAVPAFAGADEDAIAKNLEAFRAAQKAGNTEVIASICAEELSYSHSNANIDTKASLLNGIATANYKWTSLEYKDPIDPRRRPRRHRALQLCRRAGIYRRQENAAEPTHSDELAEAGQRLEAPVEGGDQALSTAQHRPG